MNWISRLLVAVILTLTVEMTVANAQEEKEVPLNEVPKKVLEAAQKAVPGITLTEAEVETTRKGVVYEIEGTVDGKEYEIEVTAEGTVLEVEEEGDEDDGEQDDGDGDDEDGDDEDDDDGDEDDSDSDDDKKD